MDDLEEKLERLLADAAGRDARVMAEAVRTVIAERSGT
jgi:hypothetical protein